ncbi:MAG TPA: ABC transporter permease [Anaerolineae bacterium]|nr:ABC transporter permease [Anaerolineae bacterium]
MADTQLIEFEATEAETTAMREAARGPSQRRRVLVFLALLAGLLLCWELVKIVFHITDFNLPHVYDIPLAFLRPLASTGEPMGLYLLAQTRFTILEAVAGFFIGALAGFGLGVLFAHSRLLERGCLPYLVASQTVPILAVAPMVVIWLGRGFISIALIASYLTFFPVVINTLRGLHSIDPAALDLMQSYAASNRAILTKLRIPAALPYLFTALKISSTACVIGALIAEMTGTQQGLGWNLVYFAQYYNTNPPNLWAAIVVAGVLGLIFYGIIALLERRIVKWHPKTE